MIGKVLKLVGALTIFGLTAQAQEPPVLADSESLQAASTGGQRRVQNLGE